ncbi:ISAs1 family transposase [Candidatus Synechococcus spongiarum]|uniref:Mobile element protein n=1 Tax=Candidatus Synechococcus spongiarum TaxID=431041 RepID=A0A170TGQ1_9SYNE|nr:ISAs1 family transposase [Candidatus Synechococcus spongiarum]CZB23384.1 Mobile element protein [Candidatus Synechococcus spongiarum]
MTLLFSNAGEPDWEVSHKGHGRLEHRQVWVSGELEGYSDLPSLSSVVMVKKRVSRGDKDPVDSVQYAVSSRRALSPGEALNLVRGHWSIENSLFHVKDDSFREDRQVLHCHHRGTVMSLFRNLAITLLRGNCNLWSTKESLIGRAQRLAALPITLFSITA